MSDKRIQRDSIRFHQKETTSKRVLNSDERYPEYYVYDPHDTDLLGDYPEENVVEFTKEELKLIEEYEDVSSRYRSMCKTKYQEITERYRQKEKLNNPKGKRR